MSKSQEVDQKVPIGELNPQQEPKKEDLFASVAKIEKPVFRSAPHPKIPLLEDFVSRRNKAFEGYLERRGGTQRMFSTQCTAMCHRSLLVIEDDPMNTYVLKNMLLTVGTLAHYCQDSAEAVRDFQQNLRNTCCSNKFTLVLTDIQIPGKLDGYRVAQCLRATEKMFADQIAEKSQVGKEKMKKKCRIVGLSVDQNRETVLKQA